MKKLLFILTCCIILTGCKKEYEVNIERVEMCGSQYVKLDYDTQVIKAKNDEEAAAEAFSKYLVQIRTAYEMRGDSYYWVPVDYTLKNKEGNKISEISKEEKIGTYHYMPDETIEWYRNLLGYKFIGTPYFEVYMNDK